MALPQVSEWRKLPVSLSELCIDTVLRCGQSFRWRKINDEWNCALHGRVLSLKQDTDHLHYRVTWPAAKTVTLPTPPPSMRGETGSGDSTQDGTEELLRHYLSIKLDLRTLYEQWSCADSNFKKRAPQFEGVRILSQDAWETLVCFICSSNNNIARISQMVHKLCVNYGPLIGHVHDEPFHDFPSPEALKGDDVESRLRALGFGYRAKYIAQTARAVADERPPGWLDTLSNPSNPNLRPHSASESEDEPQRLGDYKEAREQLLSLAGVGPKVADCVCLMGLGWGEAVPVDTHVWNIARRDYGFGKKGGGGGNGQATTMSRALYDAVGDHFRGLWGEYAGWAHSVLFTADLKAFAERSEAKREKVQETKEVVILKKERGHEVEERDHDIAVKREVDIEEETPGDGRKTKSVKHKVEIEANAEALGTKRRKTRSSTRLSRKEGKT